MSNTKAIFSQSSKMMVYWVSSVVISYFSTIVFTHFLTQKTFGDFTLTRTVIYVLAVFASFGLNHGLLRQGSIALGAGNLTLFNQIKNYTLSLTAVIGFGVCILVLIAADPIAVYCFHNPGLTDQIRFFSFVIPVQLISTMVITVFQVNKKADVGQFLYLVVYFALQLVLFYLFTFFFKENTLIIASFLIANIVYLAILFYYQKNLGYTFSLSLEKKEKKKVYQVSIPMFLSSLFVQSQKWGDTLILGILGTTTDVGIYYIGLRISVFISIPANAINKIFIPIAGHLMGEGNHKELDALYKLVTRVIFVTGSLIFGVIYFLKTYLISFFGHGYESAASIILILLISETIDFGVGAASQLITMSGGGRINAINSIITVSINIISSMLLIPKYGMLGAAFANAITNISKQLLSITELIVIFKLSPFNRK